MEHKKSAGCEACAQAHGSPVEAGCDRCLEGQYGE